MGKAEWANSSGHGPRPDREWVEGRSRRSRLRARRDSPSHQNPDLLNSLSLLVQQQQTAIDDGSYDTFLGFGRSPEEGQRMLDTFLDSPFFQPVFDIAVKESTLVREKFSEQDYRRYLAGKTFEALAITYLIAQEAQKGNVVLTPANVHELYNEFVYPGEEQITFPFDNVVVGYHGQPDSFGIDPKTMDISDVYECTAAGDSKKYKRQERSFRSVKDRGVIFSRNTKLTFIVPERDRDGNCEGNFGLVPLPFNNEQFRETMRQVYEEMRRDGQTLQERYQQTQEEKAQTERDERFRQMGVTVVRTRLEPGEEVDLAQRRQQGPTWNFAT